MAHYFKNDDTDKREYDIGFTYEGKGMSFITSDGVFSKSGLDAGSAYLLEAALPYIGEKDAVIADLGCGYGAIGVTVAAVRGNARVVMLDVNEKAVELAERNALRNGVRAERFRAVVSDGIGMTVTAGTQSFAERYDYILTNPPFRAGKGTVLKFFRESAASLAPGGIFFAVLRKQQGAESYIRAINEIFVKCGVILKKKGYVVVMAEQAKNMAEGQV